MRNRVELEEFLEYLITPQGDEEKHLFKENNLVDDYITIKQKIPFMADTELVNEINNQLSCYGLSI